MSRCAAEISRRETTRLRDLREHAKSFGRLFEERLAPTKRPMAEQMEVPLDTRALVEVGAIEGDDLSARRVGIEERISFGHGDVEGTGTGGGQVEVVIDELTPGVDPVRHGAIVARGLLADVLFEGADGVADLARPGAALPRRL